MAGKNIFNSIQVKTPKSNVFDLSHDVKLSLDMGYLVPTMCIEAIPGDIFNLTCETLLRFAPMVAPVMHRMDVYNHYFYVPYRLLWDGWEDFIAGEGPGGVVPAHPFWTVDPGDATTFTKLMDYLGVPPPSLNTGGAPVTDIISPFAMAGYQFIYNEYYRDQNQIAEVNYKLQDGSNIDQDLVTLRRRAWEHDYFTSALPTPQAGADVLVPMAGPVTTVTGGLTAGLLREAANDNTYPNMQNLETGAGGQLLGDDGAAPKESLYYDPNGTLEVQNTASSITDLRKAFKLQEFLELMGRTGRRFKEIIMGVFGVDAGDARLDRPEYITGTKSPVVVSEVLSTAETTSAPQANMAGHGVSVTSGQYGNYYVREHGMIFCITSVMPKPAYMQGIPKKFLKVNDRFDYFWPQFENIGEQEILKKELYGFVNGGEATFGYIPRFSEYKYESNRVAGDFRDSLDFWHLANEYANLPSLNQSFIECDPSKRIFAVTTPGVDSLWCHVLHKVRAVRRMQRFGSPSM